jgi:hypothetical protein
MMATLSKRLDFLEQNSCRRIARIEDLLLLIDGNLTENERLKIESLDWKWLSSIQIQLSNVKD